MKTFATLALLSASFLPSVIAHGFVRSVSIDGKSYAGLKPWGKGTSAIRRIDNTEPNHINPASGTKNDKPEHMACGRGAQTRAAGVMATAKPGAKVEITWDGGDGSTWPHNQGPLIDYLGKCDAAGCDKTDATKVQWFKINQIGKKPNQGNRWYQEDLKAGKKHVFNLPDNVPAGDYLLRHEIIALHLGDKTNGAEFYPTCINVRISGSNTGTPSNTVRFPGGYKTTDAGVKINIWNDAKKAYPFPGPAIASFGGGAKSGASKTAEPSGDDAAVTEPESSDEKGSGSESGSEYGSGDEAGSGSSEGDSGDATKGGEEGDDCTEEGDSGSEEPTPATGGDEATKTVTVTVTVTATPTSGSSSESKSKEKGDYKRSPLRVRRSRAHHVVRSS